MSVVGIVSPGAMGSALADALIRGGSRVVATLEGRSERTGRLAQRIGIRVEFELVPDLDAVVERSDVVLSIVPPEVAAAVAAQVVHAAAARGAKPLYADLNAIAPATMQRIQALAAEEGIDVVDGSISGPPPWRAALTRLYLSGPRAPEVAALPFEGVDRIVVGAVVGAASAVKMSTASVYKGSSALLAQALLAAHANGVLEHVIDDLRAGAPELVGKVERRLASAASKSARYVGEMREIAATQAAAGLTPALFEAMAEIYASLAETPLAQTSPEDVPHDLLLAETLDSLRLHP